MERSEQLRAKAIADVEETWRRQYDGEYVGEAIADAMGVAMDLGFSETEIHAAMDRALARRKLPKLRESGAAHAEPGRRADAERISRETRPRHSKTFRGQRGARAVCPSHGKVGTTTRGQDNYCDYCHQTVEKEEGEENLPSLSDIARRGEAIATLAGHYGTRADAERISRERRKLKTESNTSTMEKRIRRAFRERMNISRVSHLFDFFFEHGQWWVRNGMTGKTWSVVDAAGGRSMDGFDFEEI